MRKRYFPTGNYHAMAKAVEALKSRDASLPGLGLVYGRWGLGKTDAVEHYYGESSIYYVMVESLWTPRDLLAGICKEMKLVPEYRTVDRFDQICRELRRTGEPLFIDEADYLFRKRLMLDLVRDMHDKTRVPIILIGMEDIIGRLEKYGQFWSRVLPAGVVEFQPLTPAELSLVTQEWTGLAISPEAAEMLCRLTLADFRYLVGYLLELERACAVNQANEISMALLEALAKKQNRKRDAAARFQVGDNKRLRVAGRESVQ